MPAVNLLSGHPITDRIGDPGGFVIPHAAAYGNGTWLVVGRALGGGYTWMSFDNGATWSSAAIVSQHLKDVIYADNQFVAVGDLANIRSSTDGLNWTNEDLPGGGANLNAIAFKP